jgi:hypothetical protein
VLPNPRRSSRASGRNQRQKWNRKWKHSFISHMVNVAEMSTITWSATLLAVFLSTLQLCEFISSTRRNHSFIFYFVPGNLRSREKERNVCFSDLYYFMIKYMLLRNEVPYQSFHLKICCSMCFLNTLDNYSERKPKKAETVSSITISIRRWHWELFYARIMGKRWLK